MMLSHLVIFGIKINRKHFGRKPLDKSNLILRYDPMYQMDIANGNIEMENVYGEGSFIPYDVVPLQPYPGDHTFSTNFYLFEKSDHSILKLGDLVETQIGTPCTIFGYILPPNWEEIGLKVVDDSNDRFTFALVENDQIVSEIILPPVGIIKV
jgi:hypothetical protein